MGWDLGSDKNSIVIVHQKCVVKLISDLKKYQMNKQSNVRFGVNEGFYLHRYLLTKEYGTCTPM